jgi:nucleoside-diphosphate-sugar epimerase
MPERVLVTGVLGCLGAWVARCVLDDGDAVVGYDLGDARHRLDLVLGDDAGRIELVKGDITDLPAVERVIDEHGVTRVIHLAALQVPFVRANPPLGMHVNVAGTVNVFEAVSRRLDRIPNVVYASSTAVYNRDDPSPAPESGGYRPGTLYGVSKLADEGMARIYQAELGVPSVGLRPHTVYGPGRDQGMTSSPTVAMLAAARGEPAHIGFSGVAQYDYAPDVARGLTIAASCENATAAVYNVPGVPADVEEVVARIRAVVPDAEISCDGEPLPFPPELEAVGFDRDVASFPRTPLPDGIAATIAHFRRATPEPAAG